MRDVISLKTKLNALEKLDKDKRLKNVYCQINYT